ncbi:MAG TPA: hypothetical protein VK694_02005 [Verrucomicrobiae bacterium]|nr:hypothetical protein [Verrucomicrobiae bacterium]
MGFFKKDQDQDQDQPVPSAAAPAVDLGKRSGAVSLSKGQSVSIDKTPLIVARTSWSSKTDYDLYALVGYRDGSMETVATFGTEQDKKGFQLQTPDGAVRHLGDVGRSADGQAQETLEIRLTDDIVAVLPVAYSARSNGQGSFFRYRVGLEIDNGQGTKVGVDAKHANDDDNVYTCVPGIIRNTPDGVVIEALELYSARNSESRPVLRADGTVQMDAGPVNAFK